MADNVMFNVKPSFDLAVFTEKLANTYQAKGYSVTTANMNGINMITIEKGIGGINSLLGMGEGIRANITLNNNVLMINFSDAEWTSKIIACAVGWVLCLIPMITGIIGIMNQNKLPKSIANDANMIAANM